MTNQQRYQWSKAIWNIPWICLTLFILAGLLVIDEQPDETEAFEAVMFLLAGNGNGGK
jgi:hypothetical protein